MMLLNIIKKYKARISIILLFIVYIVILSILNKNKSTFVFFKKDELEDIHKNQNEERDIILTKGRKYLNKCLFQENNKLYERNDNPIITAIIPSYNCEKTINASIRSFQYQNISNNELIIVDDFSNDNTKIMIHNIHVMDKRIKLIENKKNMGTLYSRCIGALFAKGNYILCLDNDDLFFDEDIFDYVYSQAIKDNLDLVSFRALVCYDYLDDISKMKDFHFFGFPNNLYLKQPELGIWTLSLNGEFKLHNHMIWSKSIKTKIYKKAVNLLGIQRYSKYLCWAEDTSINFIIFNIAESFKYIYKFGYIHIRKRISATFTQNINNKLYGELYFLDVMFDFSKNCSDKNFVVNEALEIKKRFKINHYSNHTNDN